MSVEGLCFEQYKWLNLFSRKNFVVEAGGGMRFWVRPRTSDLREVDEIMQGRYEPMADVMKIRSVVDVGAHIGISTVWFENRFRPRSLGVVEMNGANFTVLRANMVLNQLAPRMVHRAIAEENDWVNEKVERRNSDLTRLVGIKSDIETRAITFRDMMERIGLEKIDLMKINIAGGESRIMIPENADIFRERIRRLLVVDYGMSIHGKGVWQTPSYLNCLGYDVLTRPGPKTGSLMVEGVNYKL